MKPRTTTSYKVFAVFLTLTLLTAFVFVAAPPAKAQTKTENSPDKQSVARKPPIAFKTPGGYMPAEFPEQEGKVLLDAKRPAGMFVVYPNEGESAEALLNLLKFMVADMFFHEAGASVTWTESPLPAHQGVDDESGTLAVASDEKMEVQLATYTRKFGETPICYGYFAMRYKGSNGKNDGRFLDSSGGGVKDFEKFWKTIQAPK